MALLKLCKFLFDAEIVKIWLDTPVMNIVMKEEECSFIDNIKKKFVLQLAILK